MSSEAITRNDLKNILNGLGASIPYEDTGAKQLTAGIKYRRKNGIVFVDCYASNATSLTTSYQTLGTLPEGYRPSETQYTPIGINNANVGVAYISNAGVVGAKTFSGTTAYYWFHFAYPVAQNALFSEKVDYVVEQGTDGIWTYRKWNSGIAECWGSYTETKSHAGTTLGGYAYTAAVYFPTDFFIDVPIVTYSAYLGNQYALTGTLTNSFSKNSISLWAVCNTSGSKTTTWQMNVKGRWK